MHRHLIVLGLLAQLLLAGCSERDPRAFESPEAAADALLSALERDDANALLDLLGHEYERQIITPDWDAEREERIRIAQAGREMLELRTLADGEVELILGPKRWPMPILLAEDEAGLWRFDTAEGIEEMLDRRIGRDEETAIQIARAYVDAQIEYAREDRDGDQVLEYAQRLASTPGKRDGLYWESAPGEPESPFGPLVRGAERYLEHLEPGDPIQGYYFRILTRQGGNPPGGAYDYVINGNMIAGFALVAWPAVYGESGIMTFVVNHQGRVYQKDLGSLGNLDAYDPDEGWTLVED